VVGAAVAGRAAFPAGAEDEVVEAVRPEAVVEVAVDFLEAAVVAQRWAAAVGAWLRRL